MVFMVFAYSMDGFSEIITQRLKQDQGMTDNRRRGAAGCKAAYGPAAGWDAYFVGRRRFAEYSGMTDIEKAAAHVEEGAPQAALQPAAVRGANRKPLHETGAWSKTTHGGFQFLCNLPHADKRRRNNAVLARGAPNSKSPRLKQNLNTAVMTQSGANIIINSRRMLIAYACRRVFTALFLKCVI